MTIYLIDPALTGAPELDSMFALVTLELNAFAPVSEIGHEDAAWSVNFGPVDGLAFGNPPAGTTLAGPIQALLEAALEAGAVIAPVASSVANRLPPQPIQTIQSYDIPERLRLLSLPDDYVHVLAKEFARGLLARVQPTLSKDRLRLFICHRRVDGEDVARRLDQLLSARHTNVFRDLAVVRPGADAQADIDTALAQADVLIFLDTPRAGESDPVRRELAGALGRGIPIVWVRLDDSAADRVPIDPKPAGRPDLVYDAQAVDAGGWTAVADEILDTAFVRAGQHVRRALENLRAIRAAARSRGVNVEVLESRQSIYALTEPVSSATRYPLRARSDVVQVFGHHPTRDDMDRLVSWLQDNNYGPHDRTCRAFDAAILLDPIEASLVRAEDSPVVVDYGPAFLESLTTGRQTRGRIRRLLILGAFPDGQDSQEPVKQAIQSLAVTWLRRGGSVVFGGHPTFTPLILEAGRLVPTIDARSRITVYQSGWWVDREAARSLAKRARVKLIAAEADQTSSLTAMRRAMVDHRPKLVLVVAVGGRTTENGTHVPGIDEEIRLARDRGLPVYAWGAPGGRAAEIAAGLVEDLRLDGKLTADERRLVAESEDYIRIAMLLWARG